MATPDSAKCDIVLSFASPQQMLVTRIQHELRRRYKIWYWPMESKKYSFANVSKVITECSIVVVCLSSDYTESENCLKEALLAHNSNKSIVPVQVSRSKANRDRLPFLRRAATLLDFSDLKGFDEVISKLYDLIEAATPKFTQAPPYRPDSPPATESHTDRRQSVGSVSRPSTASSRSRTMLSDGVAGTDSQATSRSSTLTNMDPAPSARRTALATASGNTDGLQTAIQSENVTARAATTSRRPRSDFDGNALKTREPVKSVGLAVRTEVKRRKLLKCEEDVTSPCVFGLAAIDRELFFNDVNNGVKSCSVNDLKADQFGEVSLRSFKGFSQRNTAGLHHIAPCFLLTAFRNSSDLGVWLLNVTTKTGVQFRIPPSKDAAFPCSFGHSEFNEVFVAFCGENKVHEFQLLPESSLLTRKGDYKMEKSLQAFCYNQKLNVSLAVFKDNDIEVLVLNRQFVTIGHVRQPQLESEFAWRPAWQPRLAIITDRGLCFVYCDESKELHAYDMNGTHLACVCDNLDVLSWTLLTSDKPETDILFFDRKTHAIEHLSIK